MYNGIGLETARGSGTNGYVQRNLSFIRRHKDNVDYKSEEELRKLDSQLNRGPSREILDHERKRKVELKCMEMQELMEEQGYSEDEISRKVSIYRQMLMDNLQTSSSSSSIGVSAVEKDEAGRPIAKETHQIAEASQARNDQLRAAFGLSEFYKDGTSLDPQRKAKEQAAEALAAAQKKYAMVADESSSSSSSSSPSPSPEPKKKHKEKKKSDKSGGHDKGHKKRSKHRTVENPSEESKKKKHRSPGSPSRQKDKGRQQVEDDSLDSAAVQKEQRKRTSSENIDEREHLQHRRRRSPSPRQQTKHRKHQKSRDEPVEKLRQESVKMAAELPRRRRSRSRSRSVEERPTHQHEHVRQSPEARRGRHTGSSSPQQKRKSTRSHSPPAEKKRRHKSTSPRGASTERRAHPVTRRSPAVDKYSKKSSTRMSPSRSRKPHKRHGRDGLDDVD